MRLYTAYFLSLLLYFYYSQRPSSSLPTNATSIAGQNMIYQNLPSFIVIAQLHCPIFTNSHQSPLHFLFLYFSSPEATFSISCVLHCSDFYLIKSKMKLLIYKLTCCQWTLLISENHSLVVTSVSLSPGQWSHWPMLFLRIVSIQQFNLDCAFF